MTPRQFSTPNFQFCVFSRIEGKVIVLWAHDATTKQPAKSAYYARQRWTEKYKLANICITHVFRLHLLTSQRKGIHMTQDVRPVLGGDDGEVDHLDRRPEQVVVQINPWEPAKAI